MLPDNTLVIGLLTGRQAGLVMLGLYVLLMVIVMVRQRNQERIFVWAGALFFAFFMLSTQMHERYMYPAMVLAFFAIAEDRRMLWIALPLAVTYSYNVIAITSIPFVWLGVNLWYFIGEAGLFVAFVNVLSLVVWTWILLTPESAVHPHIRRAERVLKAGLAASLVALAVYTVLPEPLPVMNALDARLENGARLLGYEIRRDQDVLGVDLFWASSEPISGDWAVFVDVLADGERIAYDDQASVVPASRWALNEVVMTHHVLDISGVDPQSISVVAGLYAFDALARAMDINDGAPVREYRIPLRMP
jgi:hypothetical protein